MTCLTALIPTKLDRKQSFLLLHLNFNLVEGLAVVHADHRANHLRQDDHVPQMGLHHLRLFHGRRLLLGLAQAFKERLLLPPQATVQPPPLASTIQLHELLTELTDTFRLLCDTSRMSTLSNYITGEEPSTL